MKKKVLTVIVTVILTLIVSALILTPYIARKYVNSHGQELIGRTINIEKIRLNYFSAVIRVIGFKLYEENDVTVFAGFDTLLVDLQPLKLLKSELVVKKLWLINPVTRITRKDTVFNFSDIIVFFSASDTTTATDTSSTKSDFKFAFSDIRLRNGRVSYFDEDIGNTTLLDNLSLSVPYLSWNQEESSKAGLKFNFRNGGYFAADGSFDPANGDFNSRIVINNLDISEFTGYIKPYIYLNSIGGLAGCDLKISGNSDLPDSISVNGIFSVNSFSATDNKDKKIAGAGQLDVSFKNSMPLAGRYIFDSVSLIEPYLLFVMYDSSNNFIELLPPEQPDTLPPADADSLSMPIIYTVNSFSIANGTVDFVDNALEEPFNYHLSQISLNVDSISSVSTWLTAYSSMKLNERGDLKAEIGINPSDPYELKVDYVITNFQLPDISPYSKLYLGSAIVYGNMYYKGKTSITARKIISDNKLIIKDAEIGRKSGGILNIPLRLALYLLKDLNGDIKIDMPVTGDLNDPTIKIGPLIWNTFKNLIVKIAASPFIALSNVFGIDQKDLQQIDFNYSDTLLTDTNLRKLDQLLMIKQKKSELIIELAYFNDRTKETEQIGLEEAGKIFREETGNDFAARHDEFVAFLSRKLEKDTISLYRDCILLTGTAKTDSIMDYREGLRIRLIQDYLNSKDTLSQIKILIPDREAIKNVGSPPLFEVKFSIDE